MEEIIVNYKEPLDEIQKNLCKIMTPYMKVSQVISKEMQQINRMYQTKINISKPQIMIYGIYNAGKSSIINALIGKEVAKVNDIPTTDSIDIYKWQGYEIADTPGVGAPIEHEKVTEEHLKNADVVLYVMSTNGSNEKSENYERMRDIEKAGKKIIIILNDKDGNLGKNDEALVTIEAKVRANVKAIGINNQFHIVVVNAARAQKGRLENKQVLINASNFIELEKVILTELKKTSSFVVIRNAIHEITQSLNHIIEEIGNDQSVASIKKIINMLEVLREQKNLIRKEMQQYIERKAQRLGKVLPDLIWEYRDNQSEIDNQVNAKVDEYIKAIQLELESKLTDLADILDVEFGKLDIDLKVADNSIHVDNFINSDFKKPNLESKINIKEKMQQANDLLENIKDLHDIYIKSNLSKDKLEEVILRKLPSFPTAMLPGLMGKNLAGRSMSYIGVAITLCQALVELLGDDGKDKKRLAEAEAENEYEKQKAQAEMQARESLQQKCEYMAEDLAEEINRSIRAIITETVGKMEEEFNAHLNKDKSICDKKMQDMSDLRDIYDQYMEISARLGRD